MAANVDALIKKIKDPSDQVRCDAWQSAGECGAAAVKPLAAVMQDKDLEVARAAKRGLWVLVRYVGRPGAKDEKLPVIMQLIGLLGDDQPVGSRREFIWMISELCGGGPGVPPLAKLLKDADLREDARCALQRIPGDKSLAALQDALKGCSEKDDFRFALASSLRKRGVKVDEKKYPCQKLVPTAQTKVKCS